MKIRITVLILACVCFLSTHAQHSCKDCVYDLYKVLGTCQSKYIDIGTTLILSSRSIKTKVTVLFLQQSQKLINQEPNGDINH